MGEGIVPQVTRIVYPSRQPRAVFDRALEIVQAVVDRLGVDRCGASLHAVLLR